MATTTNYGWTTPDDTALVKDGAAAIRSLGSAIDTTTKNLNPGTTNGDIDYYATGTTKSRVAIGSSGQCLTVSAGIPSWQPSPTSVLTTTGDLLFASAANTLARRAIGNTGDVLTVSGGLPTWAAPVLGAITLISEQTLSGASSVTFGSIPGTYKQLFLVWCGLNLSAAGGTQWNLRFNNNSGTVYGVSGLRAAGGTPQGTGNNQTTASLNAFCENNTSSSLYTTAKGFCLIDNYTSTTRLKPYTFSNGYERAGTLDFFAENTQGIFNSTSAITSIDIVRTSGTGNLSNIASTSIRLYGIN